MRSKSMLLLAVAAGCGLVAMVGAQQLLAQRGQGAPKVRVLVARAEIEPGIKLTTDLVGFREITKDSVPEGAVVKEEDYQERALRVRAFPGQVIQVAQLGERGQFGTSLDIPAGMRLVTLPASATMVHSGIMKPGDRVDVVLTYKMAKKGSQPQTLAKTILEYIQVYAMGDQRIGSEEVETGKTKKDVKNVTLLLSPLQAEILKLAEKKGDLHLTLRGVLDKESIASKGTDEDQLASLRAELSELGVEPPVVATTDPEASQPEEPAPKPEPTFAEFVQTEAVKQPEPPAETPKWTIEVFQGDERKTFEVDMPESAVPAATTTERPTTNTDVTTKTTGFWNSPLARWIGGQSTATKTATTMTP